MATSIKKRKRRNMFKKILCGVLVAASLIGACAGVAALVGKDTKKISSYAFSRGAIDSNGNYVESKTSIYTEEMFECQGLTITPDFEANGTYQVFYYDQDRSLVGSTALQKSEYVKKDSDIITAKYARVVITPSSDDKDFKIRFYEVRGYAKNYTITVNKDQTFDIPFSGTNKLIYNTNVIGIMGEGVDGFRLTSTAGDSYNMSSLISTAGCDKIYLVYDENLENDFTKLSITFLGKSAYMKEICVSDISGEPIELDGVKYLECEILDGAMGVVLHSGSVDFSSLQVFVS